MASIESSTIEQLRQAILDHGFCYQADPVIGRRVNEIAAKGFPFKKKDGLEFCKLSTFDDKASEDVSFSWMRLTHDYSAFVPSWNRSSPGPVSVAIKPWASLISHFPSSTTPDQKLKPLSYNCGAGIQESGTTRAPTYRSWQQNLRRTGFSRFLREASQSTVSNTLRSKWRKVAGRHSRDSIYIYVLTIYGRAVIDARLGFTVIQGIVINLGFATKEELKEWATMKFPNIPEIENLVNAMTCEKIGNNFELVTP